MSETRPSRSFRRVVFIAAGLCLAALGAVSLAASLAAWHVDPVPEPPQGSFREPEPAQPFYPPVPKPTVKPTFEPGSEPVPEYELTTRPAPLGKPAEKSTSTRVSGSPP